MLGSVSLIYPFGRDQGSFAFFADSALHGKVIYRDSLIGLMPLTIVVHTLALILFGRSMTAIRILDLLWAMATAAFVYLFVWKAFRRRWRAVAAGVMYSFLYYLLGYWHTAQVDGFLNLPVAAAMVLTLAAFETDEKPASGRLQLKWLGVGILIGLALLFKYTVGLILPALALVAVFAYRKQSTKGWVTAGWLLVGFLMSLAATFLVLGISGALPGFIEGHFRVSMPYSQVGYPFYENVLHRLLRMAESYKLYPSYGIGAFLGVFGLVLIIASFLKRGPDVKYAAKLPTILVLLWLGVALFSVYIQGKFFLYHYLPLVPPLAIFSALALMAVFEPVWRWLKRAWQRVLLLLLVVAGLIACSSYPARFRELASVATGQMNIRDYWISGRHDSGADFSLRDAMNLADYLRARTEPTDRVFVWGLELLANFLARRRPVSRFTPPLLQMAEWASHGYRAELMQAFRADPPEVFVVKHDDRMPWVWGHDKDSFAVLMEFTELRDFVSRYYRPEVRIGRFDVFRLATAD